MRTTIFLLALVAFTGCKPPPEQEWDWGHDMAEAEPEPTCTPDASDTFCTTYAERLCTAHFACCTDDSLTYPSMESCVARTVCSCTGARAGTAFSDGRAAFDDGAASVLLERLNGLASSCEPVGFAELDVEGLFRGSLAEGADCSPDGADFSATYACAAGTYCNITELTDDGARGTCRRFAGPGEACEAVECQPGHYCAETGCQPQLAAGAPCAGDYECATDLCDETAFTCASAADAGVYCMAEAVDL